MEARKIMPDAIKFGRPEGFFDTFERRPGPIKKNMHYCPGCGHGILHKLIAEALADFDIKDRTVFIAPVGCAVFAYYYFDCYGVSAPHGRAPAVGTALSRVNPDNVVISYQGDGDLGAIGFNHLIQAANRGENMTVFFVNNVIYGMTGGQMAPTTLPGQKTQTSPFGRSIADTGYPLKVCETISTLDSPVYVERVALSTIPNIMKARKAVRKALKNTMDRKGFSLVEFLSGCPINLKMDASSMNSFIEDQMAKYFPLGCYRDIAETRDPICRAEAHFDTESVKSVLYPVEVNRSVDDKFLNPSKVFEKERRIKLSGFGGQGVLSLGIMIATMGKLRNFDVSWLPSYGPEMRGGTANCSVVLSHRHVGSPQADHECNMLICLNQPSANKFIPQIKEGGVLIYDSSTIKLPEVGSDKIVYGVPAADIAKRLGDQKVANSVILGAVAVMMQECFLEGSDKEDFDRAFEEAIMDCFTSKEAVINLNIKAFYLGKEAVTRQHAT